MTDILDNVTAVFEPVAAGEPRADVSAAVDHALEDLDCAAGLTIVVNDPQRGTCTRPVLKALVVRTDPAKCRVLVATGSHRFDKSERAEFASRLLQDIPIDTVAWHDCHFDAKASIGNVWHGHPWLIESPAVLAVGSVEPHYFAGFTGAHKTLTIGCASHADITANHAKAVSEQCRPCRLTDNPVYADIECMLTALADVRPVSAINLVQIADDVVATFPGEPMQTLREAGLTAMDIFAHRVETPADAIIVDVCGPLGQSFYQADKGIKNNEWAVHDAGTIILVAPCPLGLGQSQFVELLRSADTYHEAHQLVEANGYQLGDHKAIRLRYLTDDDTRAVRLFLVSNGLTDQDAALLGGVKCPTLVDALAAAGIDPRDQTIYHIKDAGNVCVLPVDEDD